jgi:hypothetical protein
MGVQKFRWDKRNVEPKDSNTFFYINEKENYKIGIGLFLHERIALATQRVQIVTNWMSPNI